MTKFLSIFNSIFNDAAQPWQLGFQDSAAPGFTGIVTLHNTVAFYLVLITFSVFWTLFSIIYYYSDKRNPIAYKYLTHGSTIELIWTITPALILIAIAFPSFKLLYLMDKPGLFQDLAITALVSTPVSKIVSRSTEVVQFGVTGASNNIRLNKHSRAITEFNNEIISQLVGHLLGDGSIHYTRTSVTPYFVFTKTIKRFEYIWHVFLKLSPYCGRVPLFNPGLRKGIPYPFIQVMTRSYPALIPLYELFYQVSVNGNTYKKVITTDLLQYLNPVSLAYWAMDDGSWTPSGFYFHTEAFTFKECYLLLAMLHYRFGLFTTIQIHAGKPMIRIAGKSMALFRSIVTPHFHLSMLYKLRP
jgi:hypothetical protein